MFIRRILILFIFIIISNHSFSHGDSSKEDLKKVYAGVFHSISFDLESVTNDSKLEFVEGKIGNQSFYIPETVLAHLIEKQLAVYENVIRKNCDCDVSELIKRNRNKTDLILGTLKMTLKLGKNIVTLKVFKDLYHIFGELLWTEVSGMRRYGITYLLVSLVLEIIDHNVSPVPLCKFVAPVARFISSKVKTFFILINPLKYKDRYTHALMSRAYYHMRARKIYHSVLSLAVRDYDLIELGIVDKVKVMLKRSDITYRGLRRFSRDFTPNGGFFKGPKEELEYFLDSLDRMDLMFYSDRLIESLNYLHELTIENGKIYRVQKGLSRWNFLKLQVAIGKLGSKIDALKVKLYVASVSEDVDKESIVNHLDEILKDFEGYQRRFNPRYTDCNNLLLALNR